MKGGKQKDHQRKTPGRSLFHIIPSSTASVIDRDLLHIIGDSRSSYIQAIKETLSTCVITVSGAFPTL